MTATLVGTVRAKQSRWQRLHRPSVTCDSATLAGDQTNPGCGVEGRQRHWIDYRLAALRHVDTGNQAFGAFAGHLLRSGQRPPRPGRSDIAAPCLTSAGPDAGCRDRLRGGTPTESSGRLTASTATSLSTPGSDHDREQRPTCFTSWVWVRPLGHPAEPHLDRGRPSIYQGPARVALHRDGNRDGTQPCGVSVPSHTVTLAGARPSESAPWAIQAARRPDWGTVQHRCARCHRDRRRRVGPVDHAGARWSQTITSYAYQWRGARSDITGATGSGVHGRHSADAGTTITCRVTATNSNGSTAAVSNGIAIPAAPVNTVPPSITTDGTPTTGETVTGNDGTFTGSGTITVTRQWRRAGADITGATSTPTRSCPPTRARRSRSASPPPTQAGRRRCCRRPSPPVCPPQSPGPTSPSDCPAAPATPTRRCPSVAATGPSTPGGLDGLFGPILGSVAQAGGTFYRLVYFRNVHATATAPGAKLYVPVPFTSPGLTLAVGAATEAASTPVTAISTQTTAPSGVTFTSRDYRRDRGHPRGPRTVRVPRRVGQAHRHRRRDRHIVGEARARITTT